MLYSEMPDMSALDQDFLQPPQQQHARRSPQPNSVDRVGGERAGMTYTTPGNGRAGMGPSPGLGNWNGNNHIGNEPPPPPPQDHVMQDPYGHNVSGSGGSGHERLLPPQQRPTHLQDSRDSNNFCRGPLRTSASTHERLHPYQRPSANYQGQQAVNSRFTSPPTRPGQESRPLDNPTFDPRAAARRR